MTTYVVEVSGRVATASASCAFADAAFDTLVERVDHPVGVYSGKVVVLYACDAEITSKGVRLSTKKELRRHKGKTSWTDEELLKHFSKP